MVGTPKGVAGSDPYQVIPMTPPFQEPAAAPAPPPSPAGRIVKSLTFWIIVGTIIGIFLGEYEPEFAVKAAPTAELFLRPIQFVVFPLVFSSLVVGIAGHGDMKRLGRLSLKTFIYSEIVTTIALVLGLVAVNIIKPGEVSGIKKKEDYKPTANASTFTFAAWINHLAPKTWGEMMGGSGSSELLQVLVASILVGVATIQLKDGPKNLILDFARAVMEMMFKFVDIIIWTAPVGVCFAIANAIGSNGLSALSSLGALVATVYGTLLVLIIAVYVPIMVIFRIRPVEFLIAMREPLAIAYTTATSEAALPKVFDALNAYGVSTPVSAFVVPFGYSFNLAGTTMYLALAPIFCAQAAGVHKSLGEQIVMVLMLMISSKGVAGVRSASIIVVAATLDHFDIPQWPVVLTLGADWFMDMARTFTNVLGNCLAATVMAKLEQEFRTPEWEHERQMRLDEVDVI